MPIESGLFTSDITKYVPAIDVEHNSDLRNFTIAAETGDVLLMRYLLEVLKLDPEGYLPEVYSIVIAENHITLLNYLMSIFDNLCISNILECGALNNDVEMIKLATSKYEFNKKDFNEALIAAAGEGSIEAAEYLIEVLGADINYEGAGSGAGISAVVQCINCMDTEEGVLKMLDYLVSKGAIINVLHEFDASNPFYWAHKHNSMKVCRYLLEQTIETLKEEAKKECHTSAEV